jgi:hypothetical protein
VVDASVAVHGLALAGRGGPEPDRREGASASPKGLKVRVSGLPRCEAEQHCGHAASGTGCDRLRVKLLGRVATCSSFCRSYERGLNGATTRAPTPASTSDLFCADGRCSRRGSKLGKAPSTHGRRSRPAQRGQSTRAAAPVQAVAREHYRRWLCSTLTASASQIVTSNHRGAPAFPAQGLWTSSRCIRVRAFQRSRRGVGLRLALLSVALTACGSSASASGSATGATTSSPSKAQARTFALAVNLKAADVASMRTEEPARQLAKPLPSAFAFRRCDGQVSAKLKVGDYLSPEFGEGRGRYSRLVRSEVEVQPSAVMATRNMSAFSSAKGRACFLRFARRASEHVHGYLRKVPLSVTSLAWPFKIAAPSFGERVHYNITGINPRGRRVFIPMYKDIFGFTSGAAEVELTATGYSTPMSAATETQLLSLLVERATANTRDL